MNRLLLTLLVLSAFSAYSQTSVYHPFPESNAFWNVTAQGCCANNCPPPPTPNPVLDDYTMSYYMNGDTVFNSTTYHKIYRSGTVHHHCSIGNFVDYWESFNHYFAAIRQDTAQRRVYVYYYNPEQVLYDFNLSVGDSVQGCTVVTSIDSILIGSSYRKRFNTQAMIDYSIIEGIGSTAGLFEPICPFEYFGNLVCFSHNGQTLYPNESTSCEIIMSTDRAITNNALSISPNPFHTTATLQLPRPVSQGELKLYNVLGEEVLSQKITSQSVVFSREDLRDGIYFVVVRNGENEWREKVIIE